jgi:hypothetical protein
MDPLTEETTLTDKEKLSYHTLEHKIIHPDEIKSFANKCILIFFIIDILSYIPGMIIIFTRNEQLQTDLFYKLWWLIIIAAVCNYSISIFAYLKHDLLYDNTMLTVSLFIVYFATISTINAVVSLYSPEITLTFTSIIAFGLILLMILNSISLFDNKGWIKLAVLYTMTFTYLILYMTLIKKNIVEFFMLCIITIVFFSYVVMQLKQLLFVYVKERGYHSPSPAFSCDCRFYLTSTMIVSADIFICAFR